MKTMSHSEQETYELGKNFAKTLRPGDVVCLTGDLGAGKTVFAQGVAVGLSVLEEITSPTFALVNTYHGDVEFYHYDMYRINDLDEIFETGIYDMIYSPAVSLIEWAENIAAILPANCKQVTIRRVDDTTREIEMSEPV